MIIAKAFFAALLAVFGLWLWRLAERWSSAGEIPKDWVDSVEPRPISSRDSNFGMAVVWQKAMAALFWVFASLCVISIGLELTGIIK
ncbi:hypothetical protein [Erythrobacter sp.]|uniref:hypothetical protein n=1 Tax=Erythrobacter sp. TaxID=1042 RepID=UPI00311F50AB